LEWQVTV